MSGCGCQPSSPHIQLENTLGGAASLDAAGKVGHARVVTHNVAPWRVGRSPLLGQLCSQQRHMQDAAVQDDSLN